jgi:inhibitor of cysteine peptidase
MRIFPQYTRTILAIGFGLALVFVNQIGLTTKVVATNVETWIIDTINRQDEKEYLAMMEEVKKQVTFTTLRSCDEMWTVMKEFIEENKDYLRWNWWRWGGVRPMIWEARIGEAIPQSPRQETSSDIALKSEASDWVQQAIWGFSQTNIQVEWIDEPDILKQDWQHIYYYNETLKAVFILRIDATQPMPIVRSKIVIPQDFYNTQLLLDKNTLIILAQRWRNVYTPSLLDTTSKVHVVFYDVSQTTSPKLIKLTDYPWNILDARLKNGALTLVTQISVNLSRMGAYAEGSKNLIIKNEELSPQHIDITYTTDEKQQNLTIENKRLPYRVSQIRIPCDRIQYVFPTKEALQRMGNFPAFTAVYTLPIQQPWRVATSAALFGNTQTMYMSPNRLYLTQPLYTNHGFPCWDLARCVMPRFGWGEVTVVHAFDYEETKHLSHVYSSVIEGNPLNQWSMDEKSNGDLRIITTKRTPQASTFLSILKNDGTVVWQIRDIAPWEQFQASRYVQDILYLVTFEAIDPLFVIDLTRSNAPKIIGELKIPGYSTYLHPHSALTNGVQYLIGIGYDTTESQWWWIINWWIKLDLYKADFVTVSWWIIPVTQEFTRTLGSEWSFTEAQSNPRTFVWNPKTMELTMPLVLSDTEKSQSCTVRYSPSWVEVFRECYPHTDYVVTFAGLKRFLITPQDGIKENVSRNYLQFYTDKFASQAQQYGTQTIQPRYFHNWHARWGYTQGKPFIITNQFIDTIDEGKYESMVIFEDNNQDK